MSREPSVPFEFPEDEASLTFHPDGSAEAHFPDRNVWRELVAAAFPYIAAGRTRRACLTRLVAVTKLMKDIGIKCQSMPLEVSKQAVSAAKREFIEKLKVDPTS